MPAAPKMDPACLISHQSRIEQNRIVRKHVREMQKQAGRCRLVLGARLPGIYFIWMISSQTPLYMGLLRSPTAGPPKQNEDDVIYRAYISNHSS